MLSELAKREVRVVAKLAAPLILTNLSWSLQATISLLFVGRLSSQYLAAIGLAQLFMYVTSVFGIGAAGALEALCSQAYGAGNFKLVGAWLQRGIVVLSVYAIPTAAQWLFAGPLLRLVGQSDALVKNVGTFIT
jgi:multidrug resistance protein, MATE family